MKLVINYDFFENVLNVRESLTPLKVIRNDKNWYIFWSPIWMTHNLITCSDIKLSLASFGFQILYFTGSIYVIGLIFDDHYKQRAIKNLKTLSLQLNEYLKLKTDYDLLVQSQLYEHKYKIYLNEKKLPELMESKYILVPTYNYNNEVVSTSIVQEHVVGSKQYVLSYGTPARKLSLAYSRT